MDLGIAFDVGCEIVGNETRCPHIEVSRCIDIDLRRSCGFTDGDRLVELFGVEFG